MADKPKDEKPPEEAATDAKPAKASGGLMPALISSLVMAVILGGVGFALAYFVLPSRMQQTAATSATGATAPATAGTTNAAPANPTDASVPVVKENTTRTPAEEAASEGGKVVTKFTIEEVTVNIADTRGNRFVRAGVYFEAAPPVLEELEANRARMVDTLGQVLSTKTLDDLTSPNVRGNLREELLGIINPTLKEGRVDNIYFTDLLVQ
jgi:flagellar basal body-associated protein FliL